jgi:HSP20 family protein
MERRGEVIMAITRYTYTNPWRELDQLTGRLSRMFEGPNGYPTPSSSGTWMPAVSVEETENELILTAELPGMKPEDVDVQLENNILTIRGQRREERREEDEGRRYHLWERSFGSFERSFTLPRTVKGDDISAEFEDGLLHVRMPKAPEARSRRIEVGGSKRVGEGARRQVSGGAAGQLQEGSNVEIERTRQGSERSKRK